MEGIFSEENRRKVMYILVIISIIFFLFSPYRRTPEEGSRRKKYSDPEVELEPNRVKIHLFQPPPSYGNRYGTPERNPSPPPKQELEDPPTKNSETPKIS